MLSQFSPNWPIGSSWSLMHYISIGNWLVDSKLYMEIRSAMISQEYPEE